MQGILVYYPINIKFIILIFNDLGCVRQIPSATILIKSQYYGHLLKLKFHIYVLLQYLSQIIDVSGDQHPSEVFYLWIFILLF